MTGDTMSRLEAAQGFLVLCARAGWRFSLTEDGDMHAVVGDDLRSKDGTCTMPQQVILATLADFDAEIRQLLGAASGVH